MDAGLVGQLPLPLLLRWAHQVEDGFALLDLGFQLGVLGCFRLKLCQLRPQGLPLGQTAC